MAETQIKEDLNFGKTDHFYSNAEGFVLIKKNFFTGKIKAVATLDEEHTFSYLFFHDVSNEMLHSLKGKLATQRPEVVVLIDKELEYRAKLGTPDEIPETSELLNAKIKVKNGTKGAIIQRKFNAKFGIKFRWPWESVLCKSTAVKEIDTAAQHIDTASSICLTVDTDYRYHIIDPTAYAEVFNSLSEEASSAGKKISEYIEGLVGKKLDELVREYVRTKDYSFFQNRANLNLKDRLHGQLVKLGIKYGIEIDDVIITDVQLPDNIKQARQAAIAAQEEAKAIETKAAAQKKAELYQGEAKAETQKMVLKALLDEIDSNPAYSGLSAKEKLELIKAFQFANSKGNVVYFGGQQPGGSGTTTDLLAALIAQGKLDLGGSHKDTDTDEDVIQADEFGFLDSETSKIVCAMRGETFAGTLIKKEDLTEEEEKHLKEYFTKKKSNQK